MKVKDLINKLNTFDPEMEIFGIEAIHNGAYGTTISYAPYNNIPKQMTLRYLTAIKYTCPARWVEDTSPTTNSTNKNVVIVNTPYSHTDDRS
jgi:hypothetical protein